MENSGKLLAGKVCLVTGAGRGIGKAIAQRFAGEGAIVYANSRTPESIGERNGAWSGEGAGSIRPLCFDITDPSACKAAVQEILGQEGRLDVLVNNAGIVRNELLGMISRDSMEEMFRTNVYALVDLLQLAARVMGRQKSGSIVNIASIVGVEGSRGQVAYSASKGAVIALTKSAAKELAPKNVRVNAVAPGMIDTERFHVTYGPHAGERLERIGMGRLGKPEEIADACLFLASDLSAYVSGQILGVDGAAVV